MNIIVRKYNDADFEQTDKLLFEAFGYHKEHMYAIVFVFIFGIFY